MKRSAILAFPCLGNDDLLSKVDSGQQPVACQPKCHLTSTGRSELQQEVDFK